MLLNFDLRGAEWICVAYLTRDPAMMDVVHSGKSPHVVTGARMSGVPEDVVTAESKFVGEVTDPEVVAAIRREKMPDLKHTATFLPRTMAIRQAAKKANHGLNYGEGYKTFALKNEMDEKDAKQIVELYTKRAYPGLPEWHKRIEEEIRRTKFLSNCFQRKVYFMGAMSDDTFRQGYAFIPQSTVGDSCNQAMVKLYDDGSADCAPAQLLAQVHDSLLTQYLPTDFHAMARFAIKLGLDYMRPVLDYGEPFQLNTDLKVGMSWGKMQEVKLTDDEDKLALALEEAFDACSAQKKAA